MITGPSQEPSRDPIEDLFRDPIADAEARRTPPGGRPPGPTPEGRHEGRIPGETGIWVFVFFDVWWFTVLFAVTLYTRGDQQAVFDAGRESLTLWEGTLNTLLLLTASLFVVLGLQLLRGNDQDKARRYFGYALLAGIGFLVNKAIEYQHLIADDHDPGTNDFYQYFFLMTGVHAAHLVVGCVGLLYMRRVMLRPVIDRKAHRNLEVTATYWHVVDLLWVGIFTIFYLMR